MLIDLYIDDLKAKKSKRERKFSPVTFTNYTDKLKVFGKYLTSTHGLSLTLDDIVQVSPEIVGAFYASLLSSRKDSTCNNYVSILKGFFAFLIEEEIIQEDPGEALYHVAEYYSDTPPPPIDSGFYTEEQVVMYDNYLASIRTRRAARDRAMFALMVSRALRVSETCGIRLREYPHISKEGYAQVLRKGGKWKRIEIPQFAIARIGLYMMWRGEEGDPKDALFLTRDGTPMNRHTCWESQAAHQRACDLKTGTHLYRHTALQSTDETEGFDAAHTLSGHKNPVTTKRYLHHNIAVAKKSAQNSRFNKLLG